MKKSYFLYYLFLCCFTMLFACGNNRHEPIPEYGIEIEPVATYSVISDSVYLGKVYSMDTDERGHIFISERDNGRVTEIVLKETAELVRMYGRPGMGPGEFYRNQSISVIDTVLYVQEPYPATLSVWNTRNGELMREIKVPFYSQFAIGTDGEIYSEYFDDSDHVLARIDTAGNVVSQFGSYLDVFYTQTKRHANKRLVVAGDEGHLISVSTQHGVVEKFNSEGELLGRLDLRLTNHFVRNTYNINKEIYEREFLQTGQKVYFIYINNIDLYRNVLYVLFTGFNHHGYRKNRLRRRKPRLISVDVSGEKPRQIETYNFPKNGFQCDSFCCLAQDTILAYNRLSGNLEIYCLK